MQDYGHILLILLQSRCRPAGLPVGYLDPRPFMKQDFEYGFPGGVTEDVLFLHDVMTGTDQIYEFKVFIEPDSASAQTLMLNTSDEVSVAWNSWLDQRVAEDSTSDRLRFGSYTAPGDSAPSYFRTYMRFPLGSIPAGSTIDSAVRCGFSQPLTMASSRWSSITSVCPSLVKSNRSPARSFMTRNRLFGSNSSIPSDAIRRFR